jgi:hypothetical protein
VTLPVRPRPEVAEDLAALADDVLRFAALSHLVELESHPYRGRSLRGALGDCRKLYFDHPDVQERPRYRIVYRLVPNEAGPTEIDVICIGERANLAAYDQARERLGRD